MKAKTQVVEFSANDGQKRFHSSGIIGWDYRCSGNITGEASLIPQLNFGPATAKKVGVNLKCTYHKEL